MLSEKVIASLSHKKYRDKYHLFLIEGPSIIAHCIDMKFPIKEILIDETQSAKYSNIAIGARRLGVEVRFVQVRNIDNLVETENSQGILAVGVTDIKADTVVTGGNSVYLDGVQDPGNVGAIIRSAAAAGFRNVIAGKGTVDFFNPKVIRSTAGAFANLDLIEDTSGTLLPRLKQKNFMLTVTDVKRGKDYRQMDKKKNRLIIMGNEGEGVSAAVSAFSNERIHIPLHKDVESLNVAVAFGIIAFSLV